MQEVAAALKRAYPELEVVGSTYPPASWKESASQGVSSASALAAITIGLGDQFLPALNLPVPGFVQQVQSNNRLAGAAMVWFIGNSIAQKLVATGASFLYLKHSSLRVHGEGG